MRENIDCGSGSAIVTVQLGFFLLEKNVRGETQTEGSFLSALMNGAVVRL